MHPDWHDSWAMKEILQMVSCPRSMTGMVALSCGGFLDVFKDVFTTARPNKSGFAHWEPEEFWSVKSLDILQSNWGSLDVYHFFQFNSDSKMMNSWR